MNSVIVQLVLGLILIYFLLSLASSGIQEVIAGALRIRAKQLSAFLGKALGPWLSDRIYRHPLVRGMSEPTAATAGTLDEDAPPPRKRPSYISKETFADTIRSVLIAAPAGAGAAGPAGGQPAGALADVPAQIEAAIEAIPDSAAKELLLHLWVGAEKNLDKWNTALQSWFDSSMDRLSGWYKRWAKRIILAIAIVLAVALNADTVVFVNSLWRDTALRASVAAQASNVESAQCPQGSPLDCVTQSVGQIKQLTVPIGWPAHPSGDPRVPHGTAGAIALGWLLKLIGLALTAAAISKGAPFWFDLLNRFTNGSLRAAGKKPT